MDSTKDALRQLFAARVIFWDFDGVIKDSVGVKSAAFEALFLPYGHEVAARVRQHHEAHGGVSRYDKIPLYLDWAGEAADDSRVAAFCERFSALAMQAVIDSPWVAGVREFIEDNHAHQYFVLITATPEGEIRRILDVLGLAGCFREVHGAPGRKSDAIADVLRRLQLQPASALVVGDADTDLAAARANAVPFLLRRTPLNETLRRGYDGPTFENLTDE